MVKIEISVDDDGEISSSFLKDNILVGWCDFSREEQLALLKGMSQNFEHGLKVLNK